MNSISSLKTYLSLLAGVAVLGALPLTQAETHDHTQMAGMAMAAPAADAQATWLETAKAAYPLETCVISGDKLEVSSMGAPIDYIHKEAGKADVLVRFCCKSCVKDFKKDPAKYLKVIADAAAAKAAKPAMTH